MIQLILSYHPDLEARDAVGWTPLMVGGPSVSKGRIAAALTPRDSGVGAV